MRLEGLEQLTTAEGDYVLTVDAEGVLDIDGWMGYGQFSVTWTTDTAGPILTPMDGFPATVTAHSVDRVRLQPSELIVSETFQADCLSLLLDGTPIDLPTNAQIEALEDGSYEIRGLGSATRAGGVYELRVDGTSITDLVGNPGSETIVTWHHDVTPPSIPATFRLTAEDDTGVFDDDSVTTLQNVAFVGTSDESYLEIEVRDSSTGELLGQTTTDQASFSLPIELPTFGVHALTVNLRDFAGNETSFVHQVFVDTTGPYVDAVELITPEGELRPTEIVVQFTENVNLQQLIDNGDIQHAVNLIESSGGLVPLPVASFSYDADSAALHVALSCLEANVSGIHELRLDGSWITDVAGNPLIGGSQLMVSDPLVFLEPVHIAPAYQGETYSVPAMADMNGDGLPDLLVGVKTTSGEGAIRVYENTGTATLPEFDTSEFLQVGGSDSPVSASGCLGIYPRVFDWNRDGLADLVIGRSDGTLAWAENTGTQQTPFFSPLQPLQVDGVDLDLGDRATFDIADWNGDGRFDLIAGNLSGEVYVLLNEADSGPAQFDVMNALVDLDGERLRVPSGRASVEVLDFNEDGTNDLLLGNTEGQLLYFENIGTNQMPLFGDPLALRTPSGEIDLDGTPRSRPFAADLNGDGMIDLLVGAADGTVRLFLGASMAPGTSIDYLEEGGTDFIYEFNLPGIVEPANGTPTSITIDHDSVEESEFGATIGTVSVTDPDPEDTHTLTVSDGRFEFVGNELRLKAGNALDYESEPTISLKITATDSGGLPFAETFEINVLDVNESPSIEGLIDIDLMEDEYLHSTSVSATGDVDQHQPAALGFGEDMLSFSPELAVTGDATPTGESFLVYEYLSGYWADAEKSPLSSDDDQMCWAAAAANILAYTGWGISDDMTTADEIFAYFQEHWTDTSGLPGYGWEWWFSGEHDSPSGPGWSYVNVPGGGSFYPTLSFHDYYDSDDDSAQSLTAIDGYLRSGYGVAAGLYFGEYGHAVTVWGVSYNPDNPSEYLGIWMTDSDDSKYDADASDQLRYYEVEFDDGSWRLQDYSGSDSWEIGVVQALAAKPDTYDLWQYASDPEVNSSQLTYQIIGNTNPECGVSIVGNRYLNVDPAADWFGESDVTIQVSDGQYTATDTLTITVHAVNDPPAIDNIAGDESAETGIPASFFVSASDPDHESHTYSWDFGDETSPVVGEDLTSVEHTFLQTGTHTVTVTVTDADGESDTASLDIVVTNAPPTADAGGPYAVLEGDTVQLDASGSTDPADDELTYAWDLDGDGEFDDATGVRPDFSATALDGPVNVTVGLQVTDIAGATDTATATITVSNAPPMADAGGPYTVVEGGSVQLDASGSTDPADDTLNYAWDFDGDGEYDDATGSQPSFTAAGLNGPVLFTVGLQVTDDDGDTDKTAVDVTVTQPEAIDLGVVDFRELSALDLTSGNLWYELTAARDGMLTAIASTLSDSATLTFYDNAKNALPLAVSATVDGTERIDHFVQAGETYFVRVSGSSKDASLTLANLVATVGTEIQVFGTDEADTFEFAPAGSYAVTINGIEYHFDDTQYETIVFAGGNGDDSATLTGGPDTEVARFFPGYGTFGENGFLVTVNDVLTITAYSGGGPDEAYMYDSPGDDEFISRRGYGKLSGEGFVLETFDFMYNYGYATNREGDGRTGGSDVAYMEDTPTNDKFKFDWPKPGQFFGKMYGGGVYYNRAKNFERIDAVMTEGTNRVRLFDSEDNDTFYGQRDESRFVGDGFDVTVSGYDTLAAYASKGVDIAHLEDSDDDDTTRARPHKITLWGGDDADPTYEIMARRFDEYHFEGKHGGFDRAKLHDTALSDHVEARDNSANFYRNDGEMELLYEVVAFEWVKLYSSNNDRQDTIEKDDSLGYELEYAS